MKPKNAHQANQKTKCLPNRYGCAVDSARREKKPSIAKLTSFPVRVAFSRPIVDENDVTIDEYVWSSERDYRAASLHILSTSRKYRLRVVVLMYKSTEHMKKIMAVLLFGLLTSVESMGQENKEDIYWVVETGNRDEVYSIVRFFDANNQLLHEVRIDRKVIDIGQKRNRKRLDEMRSRWSRARLKAARVAGDKASFNGLTRRKAASPLS